ncbi:MAG TPA: ABC transporter permease [Solimonas sp.]|nr:ABC transporter permease [Solimonas sp.]
MRNTAETIGRNTLAGLSEIGLAAVLFVESLVWLVTGPRQRQPVRLSAIAAQCVDIGIRALPIVAVLSFAIGAMVAIQGIHTLSIFGAESQVTLGIALSVTREFAPLITGILVAGRSGSALAARLGTMKINEEISALTVIGINPVRYLVAPALVAMLLMVPLLTWFSDVVGLLGAGIYVSLELGISFSAYIGELQQFCKVGDILHGIGKSLLFAVLITLVGVVNGISVTGGAEGVGRVTTRSVVHAISAIVVTDMIFTFVVTR